MAKLTEEEKRYIAEHKSNVLSSQGLKMAYFQVPKLLCTGELYKSLGLEAKLAYGILEDRKSISIKNKWYDSEQRIYFIYTNEELQELLQVSKPTVVKIKRELIEYGLLEQVLQGRGKPARLYLYNPIATPKDEEKYLLSYQAKKKSLPSKLVIRRSGAEKLDKFTPKKNEEFSNSKLDEKLVDLRSKKSLLLETGKEGLRSKESLLLEAEKEDLRSKKTLLLKENKGLRSKNILPLEVKNFKPSKTNINKTNIYTIESSESDESDLMNFYKNKHLLDYSKIGLPEAIVQMLATGTASYEELQARIGQLFKAKKAVQNDAVRQGVHVSIVFEDFYKEDWDKLQAVLFAVFNRLKTHQIIDEERYIFKALHNYFEEYAHGKCTPLKQQ